MPSPPVNMPVVSAYDGMELLFVPQDRNWSFVNCDKSGTAGVANVSAAGCTFDCLEAAELASFFLALADMIYCFEMQHEICQPSVCAADLLTCSCCFDSLRLP